MIPSPRSPYRALLAGAVAVSGLVLAPQAASAATTCNYNAANHTINVTLSAAWDRAQFKRNADGTLALNGAGCGAATIYDTDAVYFKDVSGQSTTVALDAESGPFAPGYTDEGFGSEIELFVDTGDGDKDSLIVEGEASGASVAVGTQGINLNTAAEPYAADSDVSMSGVDSLTVSGSDAADWISGQGGAGTGQPYAKPLALLGAAGKDELVAGEYAYGDWLMGHAGDDLLVAGSHGDFLEGGPGNDTITGGPGLDTARFSSAPAGVDVDLALKGQQDTRGAGVDTISGVEALDGSAQADVLKGDGGLNLLAGSDGDDVLDGRGGQDFLSGDDGADTLRDGTGDGRLLGGDGQDTAAYDDAPGPVSVDLGISGVAQDTAGSGNDTLKGVEDVVGSRFADRLTGSAGPNRIDGGAGGDTIDGRAGFDRLAGGGGIDAIESRDDSPDFVSCGEGPDTLSVDAFDAVAPDCAPPAPGPPAGSAPPPAVAPVLAVVVPRQTRASVVARGLRVIVRCSTACRADGRLRVSRRAARRLGLARSAAGRVGRLAPVQLTAGRSLSLRLPLIRAARRALRDPRAVTLGLTIRATDGAGRAAAPVSRSVTLRRLTSRRSSRPLARRGGRGPVPAG